jgi:putative ABC transport system substrate-binding protein
MRRRDLMALIATGVLARPPSVFGQEPGRTYRLGFLVSSPRDAPHHVAFFSEVGRRGFIVGKNLTIDWRGFGLRLEQFGEHATELVTGQVDIISAGGDAAIRAAQRATTSIPILAMADDMLGQGFVRSLSKPGGNITGVSIVANELDGKRQEILIEAVPGLKHLGALVDANTTTPRELDELMSAARERGVELSLHRVTILEEIVPTINAAKASGAEAINVLASSLFFNNRRMILERIAALRLPAIYQWPEMAEQGGLIGYGPSITQLYRDVIARQFVEVLRGTMPADLPVQQPTKFEMAVNLKAAKALGLEVPPVLLARADELIE